jgi:chorismate--pyruvate lyase
MTGFLDVTDTLHWIGPESLPRAVADPRLRTWLSTPGLLTQRLRATAGDAFRFEALREYSTGAAHIREVALRAGAEVWVVGRSMIPLAGLQRAAWLTAVGAMPIGEAVQARLGVLDRSPFEFCRIPAGHEFARLALAVMGIEEPALWVRRSAFDVDGVHLEVHEAFNPAIGLSGDVARSAAGGPGLVQRKG